MICEQLNGCAGVINAGYKLTLRSNGHATMHIHVHRMRAIPNQLFRSWKPSVVRAPGGLGAAQGVHRRSQLPDHGTMGYRGEPPWAPWRANGAPPKLLQLWADSMINHDQSRQPNINSLTCIMTTTDHHNSWSWPWSSFGWSTMPSQCHYQTSMLARDQQACHEENYLSNPPNLSNTDAQTYNIHKHTMKKAEVLFTLGKWLGTMLLSWMAFSRYTQSLDSVSQY